MQINTDNIPNHKLPIPVADWALRYKMDKELRMYLVARTMFYGRSGYFSKEQVGLIRFACRYIGSKKTFDRHFRRALDAGLFVFDGKNYRCISMAKVAALAAHARGLHLGKAVMGLPSGLYDMPQSAFRATLYGAYAHAVHRSNMRRRSFTARKNGDKPSLKEYGEKGLPKLSGNYGQIAYRYLNMVKADGCRSISISRQSRMSYEAMKLGLIERHWYCNKQVDEMNVRSFQQMSSMVDGLTWSGQLESTSRIFKSKYGQTQGQYRVLEKVLTKWKDEDVKVYFRRKNIFAGISTDNSISFLSFPNTPYPFTGTTVLDSVSVSVLDTIISTYSESAIGSSSSCC